MRPVRSSAIAHGAPTLTLGIRKGCWDGLMNPRSPLILDIFPADDQTKIHHDAEPVGHQRSMRLVSSFCGVLRTRPAWCRRYFGSDNRQTVWRRVS